MDKKNNQYQFCVAPMLRYTDESCRILYRKFTKKAVLFTEMILFNQLINKHNYILPYNKEKNDPIIVQLAGNNTLNLSKCSKIIHEKNYKEINLNIGCPSKSSEKGNFGIYLMKNINKILDLIKSIEDSATIKISIKTRIGIENNNDYIFLKNFVYEITEKTSCKIFFIHARIALLHGFSPKKNRIIPPLQYNYVYRIKKDFPQAVIIINGGINSIKKSIQHLKKVDGVMIGRMIYKNPLILNNIDDIIYKKKQKEKNNVINIFNEYVNEQLLNNFPIRKILRPIAGLLYKTNKSSLWKQEINICIQKNKIRKKKLNKILNNVSNFL